MKQLIRLFAMLFFATFAFGQIQVLWDVALPNAVTSDSSKHLTLLPNGNVAVWSLDNLDAYDTTGTHLWYRSCAAIEGDSNRILDMRVLERASARRLGTPRHHQSDRVTGLVREEKRD